VRTSGIWEAPLKNDPPQLTKFFQEPITDGILVFYVAPVFWDDPSPPSKKKKKLNLFNILYYPPTLRYRAHYEGDISNLQVIARPVSVAFDLSLTSSTFELKASVSYLSLPLSSVSLLSFCVNVLALISQCWPSLDEWIKVDDIATSLF